MSADDLYDLEANHWTPVPNEIMEGLARVQLRPHEARVIACILRKTFGFHAEGHPKNIRKTRDRISLSQIETATGLGRRRAHEALSGIGKRHIISVRAGKDRQPKSYGINRDIAQWTLSHLDRTEGKKSTRYKTVRSGADRLSHAPRTALSSPFRTDLSPPSAHTKEESEIKRKETLKEGAGPLASDGAKARASEDQKKLSAMRNRVFKSGLYSQDELAGMRVNSLEELETIHAERCSLKSETRVQAAG